MAQDDSLIDESFPKQGAVQTKQFSSKYRDKKSKNVEAPHLEEPFQPDTMII